MHVRLAAHSLELLVARYALHTPVECARITGIDGEDDAIRAVEDHLVARARALFTGPT